MDDGSSISSGEISDAVTEISTDENLTGSSLSGASSEQNPYGSVRHGIAGSSSGGVFASRSLPVSQRAAMQSLRSGSGFGNAASLGGRGGRGDRPPDAVLGENWAKYTIREEHSMPRHYAAGGLQFERSSSERSTLPVTARERDSRNVVYSASASGSVGPTGGLFMKKSHQAIITDLKGRSMRSGTAVAIDDPQQLSGGASYGAGYRSGAQPNTGSAKQKRDSETNTERSALMMQRSRGGNQPSIMDGSASHTAAGNHQIDSGDLSKSARLDGLSRQLRQGLASCQHGGDSSIAETFGGCGSLERVGRGGSSAAPPARGKQTQPGSGYNATEGYSSGSLGRNNPDNMEYTVGGQSVYAGPNRAVANTVPRDGSGKSVDRVDSFAAQHRQASSRAGSNWMTTHNYANIDCPPADGGVGMASIRPLSDGLGSPGAASCGVLYLSRSGGVNGAGRSGGARMAMSETDSMEDLTYAYSLRAHIQQQQAEAATASHGGLSSRTLQQHDSLMSRSGRHRSDSFQSSRSEHPTTSVSPGSTLHRMESVHMTPANGGRWRMSIFLLCSRRFPWNYPALTNVCAILNTAFCQVSQENLVKMPEK